MLKSVLGHRRQEVLKRLADEDMDDSVIAAGVHRRVVNVPRAAETRRVEDADGPHLLLIMSLVERAQRTVAR